MTDATVALDALRPPEDALWVVVGPTASGKTELAITLAERFDGEVIGADSVQIYRDFDIGTGKPSPEERARATHHLVDLVSPLSPFDAARFVALADQAIAEVRARGRRPILCGGTFLWVKALLRGLAPTPPADVAVRARHEALVAAQGRAALHERLAAVDAEAAIRLAPNDFVRVSRALEVFELTGKTQSAWHAAHRFEGERHRAVLLGVARERDVLDRRIERRTAGWLEAGWVEQVRALLFEGYGYARAMDAVGFRQVRMFLAGQLAHDELALHIVRATRTFVRRQRTWLRDEAVTYVAT